jgi:hypothetical protein
MNSLNMPIKTVQNRSCALTQEDAKFQAAAFGMIGDKHAAFHGLKPGIDAEPEHVPDPAGGWSSLVERRSGIERVRRREKHCRLRLTASPEFGLIPAVLIFVGIVELMPDRMRRTGRARLTAGVAGEPRCAIAKDGE